MSVTARPTTAARDEPGGDPAARCPVWVGVICGLVSAGLGLGASELVAAVSMSLRSPIVSVGDRVIDNVPPTVKSWAISAFGTNDKAALLVGVCVLLAIYAAAVGVVATRRSLTGALVGVAVFALVGVAASLGRAGGGFWAPLPSLIGGAVAAGGLVLLCHFAQRGWPADRAPGTATVRGSQASDVDDPDRATESRTGARPEPSAALASMQALQAGSRRRFLAVAAGAGATAAAGGRRRSMVGGPGRRHRGAPQDRACPRPASRWHPCRRASTWVCRACRRS